jgi:carbonic anhydrase
VIRVAGNIIARDILGSLGYAIRHLKTPLVVVMGHEGCGAVTSALDALDGKGDEPKYIAGLLEHILPALRTLDPSLQGAQRVNAGVEANVRQSADALAQMPEGKRFIEQNLARLVRAVYELGTGRVRVLD